MSEGPVIDEADVRHVSKLARLCLSDSEVSDLVEDLGKILGYVRKLEELETGDILPTDDVVPLPTKFRSDTVIEGIDIERALRGAPDRVGNGFGVPKIIE